jgi:hypothetical protein
VPAAGAKKNPVAMRLRNCLVKRNATEVELAFPRKSTRVEPYVPEALKRSDPFPNNPDSSPRTPRFRWGFLGTLGVSADVLDIRVFGYPGRGDTGSLVPARVHSAACRVRRLARGSHYNQAC